MKFALNYPKKKVLVHIFFVRPFIVLKRRGAESAPPPNVSHPVKQSNVTKVKLFCEIEVTYLLVELGAYIEQVFYLSEFSLV